MFEERLIKIGANVVSRARCVVFLMAEVANRRNLFADVMRKIGATTAGSGVHGVKCSRPTKEELCLDDELLAPTTSRPAFTAARLPSWPLWSFPLPIRLVKSARLEETSARIGRHPVNSGSYKPRRKSC